jgi:hypothetical protein
MFSFFSCISPPVVFALCSVGCWSLVAGRVIIFVWSVDTGPSQVTTVTAFIIGGKKKGDLGPLMGKSNKMMLKTTE